jgi:hypothetical protein
MGFPLSALYSIGIPTLLIGISLSMFIHGLFINDMEYNADNYHYQLILPLCSIGILGLYHETNHWTIPLLSHDFMAGESSFSQWIFPMIFPI